MKIYALIILSFLTACVSKPLVYNPQNIKTEELVKIKTFKKTNLFNNQYNAWIERIWNEKGEELTKRNELFDSYLGEYSLPPGIYKFKMVCANGTFRGNPETIFVLEKNKNYQISCETTKAKNIIGIPVDAYVDIKFTETK